MSRALVRTLALALLSAAATGCFLPREGSPGANGRCVEEVCNGRDDDCDGEVDEEPAAGAVAYRDEDGDGFGNELDDVLGCTPPEGYVERGGDCDDRCELCFPGGVEACDGFDNDCDGSVDEGGCPGACAIAEIGGRTYRACAGDPGTGQGAGFVGAIEQCTARDFALALPSDAITQAELWALASSLVAPGGFRPEGFWIGLTDREVEGSFAPLGPTPESTFAAWADGQPDDLSDLSGGATDADCAALRRDLDGAWADERCDLPLGWICALDGPTRARTSVALDH